MVIRSRAVPHEVRGHAACDQPAAMTAPLRGKPPHAAPRQGTRAARRGPYRSGDVPASSGGGGHGCERDGGAGQDADASRERERDDAARDGRHAAAAGNPRHQGGRGVGQVRCHARGDPADDQLDGESPGEHGDDRAGLVADQRPGAGSGGGQQPGAEDGPGRVAGDGGRWERDRVAAGGGEAEPDPGGGGGGGQAEQYPRGRRRDGLGGEDVAAAGPVEVGGGGGLVPKLPGGDHGAQHGGGDQGEPGGGGQRGDRHAPPGPGSRRLQGGDQRGHRHRQADEGGGGPGRAQFQELGPYLRVHPGLPSVAVRARNASSRLAACSLISKTGRPIAAARVATCSVPAPVISSRPSASSRTAAPPAARAARNSAARGVRTTTACPVAVVSWLTGPDQVSWPRSMTMTWPAVRATSAKRWLDTRTARPSPASRRRKPRSQVTPAGSSPLPGSSRISTSGSPSRAAARPSRCRSPSERVPARRPASPASPVASTTASTRDLAMPAAAHRTRR